MNRMLDGVEDEPWITPPGTVQRTYFGSKDEPRWTGPAVAVRRFLSANPHFRADRRLEARFYSQHVGGYLKRESEGTARR